MKTIRKLRMLLLLFLIGMASMASATDIYWHPTNGSDSNNGTASTRPVKSFTKAKELWATLPNASRGVVYLMARRDIRDVGDTFNGSTSVGNLTVRRYNFAGPMFYSHGISSTLTFRNITIHGGTNYPNWDARDKGIDYTNHGPVGPIVRCDGPLNMENVTIQGAYNDGSNSSYKLGGAIICRNIADNATKYNFTMTNCTIRGCYAVAGAAVYFNGNDWHNATMNNVTIYGCYCDGDEVTEGVRPSNGIIRSNGGTRTNLTVRNCHFYNH